MAENSPSNREFAQMRRELKDAERRAEKAEEQVKTLSTKATAQEEALRTSLIEGAKIKVGPLFEKKKAERKFDDKQSKFIAARLARFVPQKPEEVEKELDAFLDAEVDEYGRIAKEVFGVVAPGPGGEGENGGKPGAEPGDAGAADDQSAYLDPAKNPMIRLD